jgi:catechol 2,3-dioxygenase-like lactoylglutathione lyase family enzyme
LISGHWDPEAAEPLKKQQGHTDVEPFHSETAILPARNVAYAALPVNDLDASVDYYIDVLGMMLKFADKEAKFAVMSGTANNGCDVCLVETKSFPAARLFFGGVQMHEGQPIKQGFEWLALHKIPATVVGGENDGALVVIDPDGIPLVYSTRPALELMTEFGPAIVAETRKLTSKTAL